jgi:serine/threonine protein kinase
MADDLLQGRYEIRRQIRTRPGQQTLLALDQQTHELVVVKLLSFNNELNWETFKLFEREARTLKELAHPAIPTYLDYFDIETMFGKGFALVQSYINAPSLEDHVKAGRTFSESELKQIAKAILEVLDYLHNRYPPIIHRDIKPGNILLTDRSGNSVGHVYLVDFGSIQAAVSEGGTRTIVGTYGYMPLEQFGERAVPASDLYALGATLIYLASGMHPADLPQRNLRICFEKYVNLSPPFVNWLQWMTEPSLEQRLDSANHALQALEHETLRKEQRLIPIRPQDSKVLLIKDRDRLDIYIPPKGFSLELLPTIGITLCWTVPLIFWYGALMQPFALFGFLYGGMSVSLILQILFTLFGRVSLHLDQDQIALKYQLFGSSYYRPRPASRHQILKLKKTQKIYKTGFMRSRIEVKPQINIWAGTRKFTIGGDGSLSEPELDWLMHALSDWLELPASQPDDSNKS